MDGGGAAVNWQVEPGPDAAVLGKVVVTARHCLAAWGDLLTAALDAPMTVVLAGADELGAESTGVVVRVSVPSARLQEDRPGVAADVIRLVLAEATALAERRPHPAPPQVWVPPEGWAPAAESPLVHALELLTADELLVVAQGDADRMRRLDEYVVDAVEEAGNAERVHTHSEDETVLMRTFGLLES
ncbi:hypothetical protein [Actinoplanes sp. NPDC051859]|uniref:hypothetical protein n=1 Tax=Actinoplanes sp. NPDC051859 TaxID=3363909 RepID=UPI0037A75734